MSKKIYREITERIIEKLKNGTGVFEMPFQNGIPRNRVTGKAYRGINAILLDGGEYATFKQIRDLGGKVKKGAKSERIVFWKLINAEDEETQEEIKIPLLRIYNVFKIGRDTEGIEPTEQVKKYEHEIIEEAENVIRNYPNRPKLTNESGSAYYSPVKDLVNVPPMKDFKDIHRYYSTYFHELVHSTGAFDRLNREGVTNFDAFGSHRYSKEELIAELGAAMLCGRIGIEKHTLDQSASYIDSWIKVLEDDYTMIVQASQYAQKAVDLIVNEYQD